MEEFKDYYTTDEVASILNRTKSTIYKYIQQGKLTPVADHKWRMLPGRLFSKEQVDRLAEQQDSKLGLTIPEAAKFLDLHSSTVKRFIDEERIPHQKGKWRGKIVSFIQEEDLLDFMNEHQEYLYTEKLKRRDYYIKDKNIAFFQKFVSDNGLEARLIIDETKKLLFLFPSTKEIISYEEGIYKYGLSAAYELSVDKSSAVPGLTEIELPKYHPLTFKFFDVYYTQENINDLFLDYESIDNDILIYLKYGTLTNIDSELYHFLQKHLRKGAFNFNPSSQMLMIDTEVESLMIHLPKYLKEWIKERADHYGSSMQEVVIQMLEKEYKDE